MYLVSDSTFRQYLFEERLFEEASGKAGQFHVNKWLKQHKMR